MASLFKSECRVICKHMHAVQDNILEYFWRNNDDDFMLRVELLGLKKAIDEALERTKKEPK